MKSKVKPKSKTRRPDVGTKKKSTALAKRQTKEVVRATQMFPTPKQQSLQAAKEAVASLQRLDDTIVVGDLGLVEIKLTVKEEEVLARPVQASAIRVKPTGQVYLAHPSYTRWLNEAFGRTGWVLKPCSKPLLNNNTVVVPYILMVHGQPVAFALGEQEYFANNRQQTYGDALESTHANGLRRCCKHLGIALELWDKEYNDAFLEAHCTLVNVPSRKKDGDTWKDSVSKQWRLNTSRPFPGETPVGARRTTGEQEQRRRPAQEVSPAAFYGQGEEVITDGQRTRLWTIARGRGRSKEEVAVYLKAKGYDTSHAIKRKDYETITTAIEHPGPLGVGLSDADIIDIAPSRVPGEDDE